ncbi:MAG: hypothetical protein ACREPM_10445, partial [Gemmatimonadaceae bacterium]
ACGTKDAAKTDTGKVAQAGAAANSKYDPATRTATVHAKEFAFDAADSIPAGWTNFHFVNDGSMLHHLQIARLDSGKTPDDFVTAMSKPGPPPAWVTFVGGPNAPNPGAFSHAAFNLPAGSYIMLCLVDIPDHVPHFAKGMVHPFTVTASTAAGAEPASDATIALADYSFTVTGALTAGHHTIKVTNAGPQVHELELVKFATGKGMKDLAAWAASLQGPPPADALGGVAALMSGLGGTFDVDLTPGNYAFICFVPDAKDGKPHLEHGMAKEFKVN